MAQPPSPTDARQMRGVSSHKSPGISAGVLFSPSLVPYSTGKPSWQFTAGYFYDAYAELRCTLASRESNSFMPRAVAPGAFLYSCYLRARKKSAMADRLPAIQFDGSVVQRQYMMAPGTS